MIPKTYMNFMDQKSNMLLHYSLHEILQNTQIYDYTILNVPGIKYIYINIKDIFKIYSSFKYYI